MLSGAGTHPAQQRSSATLTRAPPCQAGSLSETTTVHEEVGPDGRTRTRWTTLTDEGWEEQLLSEAKV